MCEHKEDMMECVGKLHACKRTSDYLKEIMFANAIEHLLECAMSSDKPVRVAKDIMAAFVFGDGHKAMMKPMSERPEHVNNIQMCLFEKHGLVSTLLILK